MRAEDKIRIMRMIESAQSAQEFLADKTYQDLQNDRKLAFAVVRALVKQHKNYAKNIIRKIRKIGTGSFLYK